MSANKDYTRDVQLDPGTIEDLVVHVVQNNDKLQEDGLKACAVEIIGHAGLGKTSLVEQIGLKLKKKVVKINLGQLDELGDLVGFPMKEYEICISTNVTTGEKECKWVTEIEAKNHLFKEGKLTGDTRMGYALPEWIIGAEDLEYGGILLLDDFSRAQTRFMQAAMEIVDKGEFYSWKLPKKWSVILTSNPPDGKYMVAATDVAQQTRYSSFGMTFDKEVWAKWAENTGIDG